MIETGSGMFGFMVRVYAWEVLLVEYEMALDRGGKVRA